MCGHQNRDHSLKRNAQANLDRVARVILVSPRLKRAATLETWTYRAPIVAGGILLMALESLDVGGETNLGRWILLRVCARGSDAGRPCFPPDVLVINPGGWPGLSS
jgi:hypothetical protein